jgi:hypothetical protein
MKDHDEPPTPSEKIPTLLGMMATMNKAAVSFQRELGECLQHVLADGATVETLAGHLDLSPDEVHLLATEPLVPASVRVGISEDSLDRISAAYRASGEDDDEPEEDHDEQVERFRSELEDVTPDDFT